MHFELQKKNKINGIHVRGQNVRRMTEQKRKKQKERKGERENEEITKGMKTKCCMKTVNRQNPRKNKYKLNLDTFHSIRDTVVRRRRLPSSHESCATRSQRKYFLSNGSTVDALMGEQTIQCCYSSGTLLMSKKNCRANALDK